MDKDYSYRESPEYVAAQARYEAAWIAYQAACVPWNAADAELSAARDAALALEPAWVREGRILSTQSARESNERAEYARLAAKYGPAATTPDADAEPAVVGYFLEGGTI